MLVPVRLLILCLCLVASHAQAASQPASEPLEFDDRPLIEPLILPDWFKLSFLDLKDSLADAKQAGKRGVIVYFHRHDCAYCKAQIDVNWGSQDITDYTRKYFDVIAIDVLGARTVTDFNGKTYTEKAYATHMKSDFTPKQAVEVNEIVSQFPYFQWSAQQESELRTKLLVKLVPIADGKHFDIIDKILKLKRV